MLKMTITPYKKNIRQKAYRIVFWQLGGVVLLALIVLTVGNASRGFSVLVGGMAYGLPNLAFAWCAFRYVDAADMSKFLGTFFAGETCKLVLSAILFLLIVKWLPVSLLFVLIGYIGAIVAFWIVCIGHFPWHTVCKT